MFGKRFTRALVVTTTASLVMASAAFAADLSTDAVLSSDAAAPTEVSRGNNNAFTIKVWLTGNLQSGRSGEVEIVNKYFMNEAGAIAASSDAADRTTLTFADGFHYTTGCTSDPATAESGCAANPKTVSATLVVDNAAANGLTGTLIVAGNTNLTQNGIDERDEGASWDVGYVEVVVASAYTISGFHAPVENRQDGAGLVNGAKAGSTIPLKFNIYDGQTLITDTTAVSALVQKTPCAIGSEVDMLDDSDLSSSAQSLRWDGTQFIFNWKTNKAWVGSCYRVTAKATGGASVSADFQFNK